LCLYWIRKIRKEMKYLKRFNESNTDDVIENVKDILLPISDMGYEISVTEYRSELAIRVVTWTDKPLWITDEVKEEFIRMKDYLQSEGYDSIEALYHLATPGDISSRKIEEFDRFMRYEQWQKVKIGNLIFVAKRDIII
jgi:hypothetical protein